MRVGEKYLCANGMIALIKHQVNFKGTGMEGKYPDGTFSATMINSKGELLYNADGRGWTAEYDSNGDTSNESFTTVKLLTE
jgi:hypothetical protein